jgi:hypothetical protein
MTDWIKQAARGIKDNRERVEREREQARYNAERIKIEAPRIWKEITIAMRAAVDEFNAQFAGETSSSDLVNFTDISEKHFLVSTVYCQADSSTVGVGLLCEAAKEAIECKIDDTAKRMGLPGEAHSFYFKAFDNGSVAIMGGKDTLTVPSFVERILNPIFQCADFP